MLFLYNSSHSLFLGLLRILNHFTRDVLQTLQQTRPLFESYLRIRSLNPNPSSPELQQARTELSSTLTDLTADLSDLVESVRAIEQDPYRFGIELTELARRRKLVDDVGNEVEDMRHELANTVSSSQPGQNGKARMDSLPNPADFDNVTSPTADEGRGSDDYASWEQQRQTEMMAEQDETLDDVFKTVGNLRQQADDMGRELEEQAGILEEVDGLAERVGGKLQGGLKRVGWVIKKNEGTLSGY